MAESETSPRLRRRAGLKRLASLLEELRVLSELREARPATFEYGSRPFLHFHYRPDGTIVADVQLSNQGFTPFDVSEEVGQQEVLSVIERYLGSRNARGGRRAGRRRSSHRVPPY
jgi:hypothetical protein